MDQNKGKIGFTAGNFDLIHPGHINHLKKAKSYGNVLIVTITADKFVNKKLQGTYYNQNQRAEFLSNLEFVDFVSIINEPSAITGLKTRNSPCDKSINSHAIVIPINIVPASPIKIRLLKGTPIHKL